MIRIMRTGHTATRIFSALAAITVSMLAVSCRNTRISEEVDTQNPIRMGASFFYTRAIIGDVSDMQAQSASGDAMGVFGDKIAKGMGIGGNAESGYKGKVTQVFTNQAVSYSNTASSWTYTPTKYWDRNAYYHFVAYWPKGTADIDADTRTLTVSGIPNWQEVDGSEKDYLYAMSKGTGADYVANASGTVNFTFNHFLAKINIKAYYVGDQDRTVTITGIEFGKDKDGETAVNEVPLSSGDASFTYVYTDISNKAQVSNLASGDAHNLITDASGDAVPQTAFCKDDEADPKVFPGYPNPSDNGGIADICSWLVVPFSSESDIPLTVSYKIDEVVKIPAPTVTTNVKNFESGKEYTIILRFDTNSTGMECTAVYVKNWEKAAPDVNKTVHNW